MTTENKTELTKDAKAFQNTLKEFLKTLPSEGAPIKVPVSVILIDEDFNARKSSNYSASKDEVDASNTRNRESTQQAMTQMDELALDIKNRGLDHFPVVRPQVMPDKSVRLVLVSGFRRMKAIKDILKWSEVMVNVKEMSEKDAHYANLAENMARKDLKPYEVALKVMDLRTRFNEAAKKVGERLNLSTSYVNFLTRIIEQGHSRLLRLWADGKFPGVLTVDNLYKWSALTTDEQIEAFNDARVSKGFDEEGNEIKDSDDQSKGPKVPAAPNKETIKDALARARGGVKGKDPKNLAGVIAALTWVLGESDTLDGWYDPKAEKEAIEKRAKAEKAREAARKAAEKAESLAKEAGI